jgi:hypothetical protein
MKNLVLVISASIILLLSCNEDKEQAAQVLTLDFFEKNLQADMNYSSITNAFGLPSADIGSGIHIYVYPLSDGTQIRIGYVDKIMYARQCDKNGNVIKPLL